MMQSLQATNEPIGTTIMKLISGKNLDILALAGGVGMIGLGVANLKYPKSKIVSWGIIGIGIATFLIHASHLKFTPGIYEIDKIINICKMQYKDIVQIKE